MCRKADMKGRCSLMDASEKGLGLQIILLAAAAPNLAAIFFLIFGSSHSRPNHVELEPHLSGGFYSSFYTNTVISISRSLSHPTPPFSPKQHFLKISGVGCPGSIFRFADGALFLWEKITALDLVLQTSLHINKLHLEP